MLSDFDDTGWLAAGLAVAVTLLYLAWDRLFGWPDGSLRRAVEAERVEVRAATAEGAAEQLSALSASVYPRLRPESLALDRAEYAEQVRLAVKSTSPLLPTTAMRVWVGPQLVAVVRVPNPNYAAGD